MRTVVLQFVVLFSLCIIISVASSMTVPQRLRALAGNETWSYGQLGLAVAGGEWQELMAIWPTFNSTAQPDTAFTFRDAIMDVRELLDIFAYAYPMAFSPYNTSMEIYALLELDLQFGYISVGDFMDLRKLNYTEKDRQVRLAVILGWMTQFEANTKLLSYADFIANISLTTFFTRPKSDLSIQYWGSIPDVPSLKLTGFQNIAVLGKGQWQSLYDTEPFVFNLTEIWLPKEHDEFHNYRKHVGYSGGLVYDDGSDVSFPEIIRKDTNLTGPLILALTLDNMQGKINDLITAYQFYTEHGNTKSANHCLAQIKVLWPELQQWVIDVDWRGNVKVVIDSFIAIG